MNNLWIIDNGHGKETAGKRSPIWSDGKQLFEWEFNRDIVRRIVYTLSQRNDIKYHVLVPEDKDISLEERVERANDLYKINAKSILISIHGNAGGGSGWECWTSVGETSSDNIAAGFFLEAMNEFPDFNMRRGRSLADPSKESNFYILTKTYCPAILTENFFFDNEKECRLMMDNNFRQKIANVHIKGILKAEGII
jgi:N-acetylmuramoyl-L-alanine amidase